MRRTLHASIFALLAIAIGCNRGSEDVPPPSVQPPEAEQVQPPKAEQIPRVERVRGLAAGDTVYLRVQQYETAAEDDLDPPGEVISLSLGDEIKLIKKSDTSIPSWLVSKGEYQAWIPFFFLTADKDGIAYLASEGKTPETLSYYDRGENTSLIAGKLSLGMFVVHSTQGMGATSKGSAQVAFEGNGFLISKEGIDATNGAVYPITMECDGKVHELRENTLYLYKGKDSNEEHCFECISLQSLTYCE